MTPARAILLLAAACGLACAQDPREIARRGVQQMEKSLLATRDYDFEQRSETREFDSAGRVKSHKIVLYEINMIEGTPYRRVVGRDDRPVSAEEARQEQAKLDEAAAQRKKETPAERQRRVADWEARRQRDREPIAEIPEAFDFRIAGHAPLAGRDTWVIEATPRPGFHGRTRISKLFSKFRGKVWIDTASYQWLQTEAEVADNIWWGLFFARLSKGARLDFQMTPVNGGVWLPGHFRIEASARVALVKAIHIELDTTYSNYRKLPPH
ncbi:MAG TPA: hypothetical protein VMT86_00735 [Bryobacteraceae bacterium]|nr:hypothetical protein [Bryobacteraceae bacterium]